MSQVTITRPRFAPPLGQLRRLRGLDLPREVPLPARDRRVAALLALAFGWAGGHKLYLMRFEQALLSLLFCWTLVPLFVGLAEGVAYLLMTDREFARRYDVTRSYACRLVGAMLRASTRPARGWEFKPYRPW